MKKRIISLLMCFCMVVSLLPTSVLAASDEATNDSELTEQSSAQSMTTKASAEKEQIYWAIVNTGNSEEKLVISAAEYLLQDGESYEKQGNGGDAKGSFDVDYKFESPDDPVWHHWWYYITTADVLADGNGKKVAPTYTRYWFYEQKNLTSVNLSGLDMSNVIDAQGMFAECQSITNLDAVADWNVKNVKYMGSMFSDCSGLTSLDISRWKVCNLDDGGGSALASMFYGCSNLTTLALPNFQGKISNTRYMFKNCSKLETLTLPLGFLSQGFSYSSNFAGPLMSEMFYGCSSLTNLDVSGWNVSGVYSMEQLFYNCSSLTNLDVSRWDVSKVKEMEKMFYNCSSLTSLDLAGWDLSIEKYSLVDMFTGCSELSAVNLTGGCPAILYGSTNSDGQNSNGIMLPGSLIAYVKHEETENGKKQSAAWIYPGQSSGMLFVTDGGTLSETDLTDPSKVTVTKDGKTSNGWCEKGNNIPVSNFTNGTVYYPYYRPETCTVSFDANAQGADNPNKRNVKYGETLGTLPTLNRDGYAFLGWFTAAEGGTKVTADTSITYSMTLYARYIANTYTVKFDDNGATSGKMDDQTFSYDTAKNLTPNAFVKTGYTFAGWSTTEDGSVAYKDGEEVKNLSAVDGDEITLYAQWTTNSYTVKFNGNGATSGKMDDQTFGYDVAKKLTQNAFVKTGYAFAGWKDGNDNTYMDEQEVKNLTAVQGDVVTLTAQWTTNSYTVKFNGNGATNGEMADQTFSYDTAKNLTPNAFVKTGYTFAGWKDGNDNTYMDEQEVKNLTAVQGDVVTLTAQWTTNSYTVKFNGNGATSGEMADQTFSYDAAKNLTPNAFVKTGYTFAGWSTTEDGSVAYKDGEEVKNLSAVDGDEITLYAQWTTNSYTVKFNGNGATSGKMDDQTFGYDVAKKLTQNAFVKTGYTFAGWKDGNDNTYMDEQEVKNLTAVQGDVVTLTAQWTPTQYRISYELNGGTNANANPAVYTIEDNDVTLVAPTREGYTFSGWTWEGQTEPTVTAVISKGSTGNKSFTANWMANTYTIHFVGGDGTEGSTVDVSATYDQSVKLMPNGFTKADWKFLGWRTSNATTVEYTDGQTVTNLTADDDATVTLYAVWQEKSEFNPNLEVQHQIYDGHAKEFTLDGGYTIAYKQGAETVSEPIEAGTYDVVITKAADDDHKAYLRTFEGGLIIDKADVTNTAKDNQHCIFGDTYDVSSLFEKDVNAGEATYALAENTDEGAGSAKLDGTILTITKAGTIKITMTTAGTNNYNAGVAVTATLTVDKASPKVNISVDKASVVGGGTVKLTVSGVPNGGKVTVTQTDDRGSTAENLDLTANGEISVRLSNMVAKYTFTVVYDGDDNHNGDKDSCEVSVTRRTSSVANPGNTISVPSTPNGTVTVTPSTASKDTTVTITTKPNEGYELGDLTVKDANGNTLPLTDKGDGKYTFTMPDSKVSVEAEFVKAASTGFVDVPVNAYFADAVKWAVDRGITNGLSDTMFGPYESCTRAQIVTFLWRAAGSPEPKTVSSFSDVPASAYYAKAVAWAVENGITNGMTETTFEPNATCTRGQSVTFLYRALKGTASGSASFTDVAPDAFYADAVNWAVANNVTNGTSATTFSPNADCTRAEIVTFLYRAYQGK